MRALLLAALLLMNASAFAGLIPEKDPWPYFSPDQAGNATFEHADWQSILDTYLDTSDRVYRFRYAAVSAADRQVLKAYLVRLTAADPRLLSRDEQFAYWVNLYNALTVDLVLDYYPVKSIRRIEGGLLGLGPWNEELVAIQGKQVTLNDIEHRILRPFWNDPRIHFAVNCASVGCPNLGATAYTGENKETLLDAAALEFLTHPRGAGFDGRKLTLSSIFNWYGEDFGSNEAEVLGYIAGWLPEADAARVRSYAGRVRYDYDWDLNEAP